MTSTATTHAASVGGSGTVYSDIAVCGEDRRGVVTTTTDAEVTCPECLELLERDRVLEVTDPVELLELIVDQAGAAKAALADEAEGEFRRHVERLAGAGAQLLALVRAW